MSRRSFKIGYFVPEFPGQTHGFFWREIQHLEALGAEVQILSSSRPKTVTDHAFSVTAQSRTRYLRDINLSDLNLWLRALAATFSLLAKGSLGHLTDRGETRLRALLLAVFAARLKVICEQDDIRHVHGHSCADVAYLLALSKLAGGPDYSLSLHGDLVVYGRAHDFKFQGAKFVACVTEALCQQVKDKVGAWQGEPQLVRMGIEPPDPSIGPRSWSATGKLRLVTVSRLNQMKGHKHAIAAVRMLVDEGLDVHYDIIGEGEYHAEIRQQIHSAGLQDRVRLIGPVANDLVPYRLKDYDVFVLPSVGLGEAAPVAVMEAMSAGMPVVCSIIGGTPEMIEDGHTGFLFPQADVDAMVIILRELALSPELRMQIGSNGKKHALAHFLSSVSAQKLLDLMAS